MTHELYRPRAVSKLGTWAVSDLHLKVYGLQAGDHVIMPEMEDAARAFISDGVLTSVKTLGDSDGLGFAIIHSGTLGLSISVHWWTQGSVLAQRFFRRLYGADAPLDMSARPSIGCVWELGLIAEETQAWRETMMGKMPQPDKYLARFAQITAV